MRAIILAAGFGARLRQSPDAHSPKCLLRFGGMSLLERHLRLLNAVGVNEIVLALGFQAEQIQAELTRLAHTAEIVFNPHYKLGSMLTVHTAAAALTRGGDVLLMDADVLYDDRILHPLVAAPATPANRLLLDRGFEPGVEPVKLCVKNGVPVELRKQLATDLAYDTIGESVGFFRFNEPTARRLAEIVARYIDNDQAKLPHEEAIRDLLLERGRDFEVADVTDAPWLEIDFPADIVRANQHVLPRLRPSLEIMQ